MKVVSGTHRTSRSTLLSSAPSSWTPSASTAGGSSPAAARAVRRTHPTLGRPAIGALVSTSAGPALALAVAAGSNLTFALIVLVLPILSWKPEKGRDRRVRAGFKFVLRNRAVGRLLGWGRRYRYRSGPDHHPHTRPRRSPWGRFGFRWSAGLSIWGPGPIGGVATRRRAQPG